TSVVVTLFDTEVGAEVDVLGAPSTYSSTWAGNESLSRFPDGQDTGDDLQDLVPRPGTPGHPNGDRCGLAAGDVVVNEVVADPERDWSNDSGGVPFDGSPGTGGVGDGDEYVELRNNTEEELSLVDCVVDFVDTTPSRMSLLATDPPEDPGAPYVRVF